MNSEISSQAGIEYPELVDVVNFDPTQDDILRSRIKEQLLPYLLICFFVLLFFLFEMYRWKSGLPPMPFTAGIFFLAAVSYFFFRLSMHGRELRFLYQGRKGEPDSRAAINQYVESTGGVLFSDVEVLDGNIDFVIINQHGVTLVNIIEWRTPSNADAVVDYADRHLLLNGYQPDVNPVEQMGAVTAWLEKKLRSSIDQPIDVTSVIVFPGWFIRQRAGQPKVHVINPRELSSLLRTKRKVYSDNDNCLLNYHVSKILKKAH